MTLDSRNGNEIKQSCSLLGLKKKLMVEISQVLRLKSHYMVESYIDNKGKKIKKGISKKTLENIL